MAELFLLPHYDMAVEQYGMRKYGLLGRGAGMGNALYSITYLDLPPEAKTTITLIAQGGPFPFPGKDGTPFGNRFGDLPEGKYLEYTVTTPGIAGRGKRRIVARKHTGQIFFTASHYERVEVKGGASKVERHDARVSATKQLDEQWRNGFYVVTGMDPAMRSNLLEAIRSVS